MNNHCNIPPEGWACTRKPGHDGPCAAIPENWEKQFDREFRYTQCGQWLKRVDGYEDENDQFIVSPNEAYAVPEFVKGFIRKILKQQRSEVAREIKEEISIITETCQVLDSLKILLGTQWSEYDGQVRVRLSGLLAKKYKENEE